MAMAFPDGVVLTNVIDQYLDAAGKPVKGTVTFKPDLSAVGEGISVAPVAVRRSFDALGRFSVFIPASVNTGLDPDFTYEVTLQFNGGQYSRKVVQVPVSEDPVILDSLIDTEPYESVPRFQFPNHAVDPQNPQPGQAYYNITDHVPYIWDEATEEWQSFYVETDDFVTHPDLNAELIPITEGLEEAQQDIAALETGKANVSHVHVIGDVTGLQTALNGKQPAGTYVIPSDLSNYATTAGLTAGLDTKLNKAGGEVVDSTLVVRKGDSSSGIRMRATGGAVDYDKMNGDIIISSFAGPGFTGAQTNLQRWRNDGNTFVGKTSFSTTAYGEEQIIDATSGEARLGAKNGASNIVFAGYVDVSGAPATGTWAAGNVVMTKTGVYRCTIGGTPGTWTNYSATDPGIVRPTDHNYGGWTYDNRQTQGNGLLATSGLSYVARIRIATSLVTNIHFHVTTPGATLTAGQCFATLHNDAGVILSANAVTADLSTSWNGGGMKTHPLVAPQVTVPGDWYKIRWWFVGTTGPTFSRACSSSSAIINGNLTAPNFMFATADSGLTTAALAPGTIGTQTGDSIARWAAVS
jgi:hypothetical protein